VKVGLVAPPWVQVPPVGYGGTEAVVDLLARGLEAAGHEVLLFTVGESTCPVPRRWLDQRAVEPMGSGTAEAAHVLAAYAAMAEERVDVVHDHTALGPLLGRTVTTEPVVVTTSHLGYTPDVLRLLEATARVVPVVAISHAQAAAAPRVPFTRVIHHGVDLDRYRRGDGDGGYLAFLGRMSPDKGPDRAIEAARRAGLPLRMCAKMRSADEVDFFEQRVRPLLGPDVEYAGELDDAGRVELLRGAVALLMVEALACGTPVLVAPLGAAPEIVDDGVTGFLCPDDDAFVAAIGRVSSIDRSACRAAAEERFSGERMTRDHLDLYVELLGRRVIDLAERVTRR
jgi:glycosyltransferase involved in cell wall biosynthesis